MTLDTKATTIEQAREKLKQAIDLGAHDDADYWRDWIKGYAEGELKKARALALKMIKKGTSIEDIADLTELSVEEIEELKTESK